MREPNRPRTLASGLLTDARRRSGLTQAQLADQAGVARALVSQYETGRKDPSLTTLARLIRACGMDLRMSADVLSGSDRAQYERDERIGLEEAFRNAERARSEVLGVRRPSTRELAELRMMEHA